MATKKEIKVERFSGGISDDVRQNTASGYSLTQHFDTLTSPYRLIPFRDSEADNTTQVGIMNFAWTGTILYGLGLKTSTLRAQIYQKTGVTGSWAESTTATSATISNFIGNTFIIYKGYTYQIIAANSLDRWQIGGTYTDAYQAVPFTAFTDGSGCTTQAIIHGKNDTMYFGYYSSSNGSRIFSLNNTTPTVNAFQLPTNMIVTAVTEYGSYLAIACRPATTSSSSISGPGSSKVFLWDLVSSTATDVVDFGYGDLWALANVGGYLVGVMNGASSSDITFTKKRVHIKTYAGGAVQLFKTLEDDGLEIAGLVGYKPFIANQNGISFGLYSTGSKVPTGIYTFSRPNETYPFAVTCERLIHNTTAITSFVGMIRVGDVMFTAYNHVAGTSSNVGRTNDTASYTNTSVYESQRFGTENTRIKKNVIGVTVNHEYLPSGASVVVKYKKDAETSWTTIFTSDTDNALYYSAKNITSSGAIIPEFREIQFRIESTGGAVITGFSCKYEENPDDIYE